MAARLLPTDDPPSIRLALIAFAILATVALILLPLSIVVTGAFQKGTAHVVAVFADPATGSAIRLTLLVIAGTLPLNAVFGFAAAWAIARFDFPGRGALITLIDLPLALSPVIAGLVIVLVFGARAPLGPWLAAHHLAIVFTPPAVLLATILVTFPLVARELIPAFQAMDRATEEAALVAGATGWQLITRITLPTVRHALVSSIALAVARAAGEFGAVAVVSGHIPGRTNTLSLHIASLYDSGDTAAAFAVALLLVAFSLGTLVLRRLVAP